MKKIVDLFKESCDLEYKNFNSKLIPNVDKKFFIGVRIPIIRKISKNISFDDKQKFISEIPHKYFEENILHSIIINEINDFDKCIFELDRFLPYVDNWSVCDTLRCDIFCDNKEKAFLYLNECLCSNYVYKIRFAFLMMLKHFICEEYIDRCNNIALNYKSDEYYINMVIAWYFSYALIFEYDKTIRIFENKLLSKWVHNKSIQKAIESYRISDEKKNYLKGLRIK